MNDDSSQGREREIGERIAKLVRSIGQGPEEPITSEEQKRLKAAAGRLDQMLKAAAEAEQRALKNASVRLDELLTDIRKGKDFTDRIKRRGQKQSDKSQR